ncbi:hypothetical protein [Flavobacterium kingsejongi]|nr:hypothetical protein [Flavobacterium kingsejongi]
MKSKILLSAVALITLLQDTAKLPKSVKLISNMINWLISMRLKFMNA